MPRLTNANTYARSKCNNGWCAAMYANYTEKDEGIGGHKHDWEHIVLWVQNDEVKHVSSSHGEWKVANRKEVRFDGVHPKLVYHKEGGLTHLYRLANESDDQIENETGRWFYPAVVGWTGYPNDFRDRLLKHDFGTATIQIGDDKFNEALKAAMPSFLPFDPFAK